MKSENLVVRDRDYNGDACASIKLLLLINYILYIQLIATKWNFNYE